MTSSEGSLNLVHGSPSQGHDDDEGDCENAVSPECSRGDGNYEADVSVGDTEEHNVVADDDTSASVNWEAGSPPSCDESAAAETPVVVKEEPPELLSDLEGFHKEIDQELFARGIGPDWRKAQLKMPRREKPEDHVKGETCCTKETLRELRRTFNVPEELKLVLPSRSDRANSPPPGHVTLYESYFFRCLLWFPIPAVIMRVLHEVNISISQVVPRGLRHLIGILVRSYECGLKVTVDHFHHCLAWQGSSGGKNHHSCKSRGDRRIIHGFPSKDTNWDTHFFYVPVNEFSFERECLNIVKSKWRRRGRL